MAHGSATLAFFAALADEREPTPAETFSALSELAATVSNIDTSLGRIADVLEGASHGGAFSFNLNTF